MKLKDWFEDETGRGLTERYPMVEILDIDRVAYATLQLRIWNSVFPEKIGR